MSNLLGYIVEAFRCILLILFIYIMGCFCVFVYNIPHYYREAKEVRALVEAKEAREEQEELSKVKEYIKSLKGSLYCDDKFIGEGDIVIYEHAKYHHRGGYTNSSGIWHIDNKVYNQEEGSLCEVRK